MQAKISDGASQFVEIFRHLAEAPYQGSVVELPQTRIARALERERANVWLRARHRFGAADRGRLIRTLLRLPDRLPLIPLVQESSLDLGSVPVGYGAAANVEPEA